MYSLANSNTCVNVDSLYYIRLSLHKAGDSYFSPCGTTPFKRPRRAVCSIVLNLLSQVRDPLSWIRLGRSLSRYLADHGSHLKSVGSKPVVLHHEHSRVSFLYHNYFRLCRSPRVDKHLQAIDWLDRLFLSPLYCFQLIDSRESR